MRCGRRGGAAVLAVASLALCGAAAGLEPEDAIEIDSLRELQELLGADSGNAIVPEEGLERLVNLEKLVLFNESIEEIPSRLFQLPSLTYLNLRGNKLTKLPALDDSQTVNAKDLPCFVQAGRSRTLTSCLKTLDLGDNRIDAYDSLEVLGTFHLLTSVFLDNNSLTAMPKTFLEMELWNTNKMTKSDVRFDLRGNPFLCDCTLADWVKPSSVPDGPERLLKVLFSPETTLCNDGSERSGSPIWSVVTNYEEEPCWHPELVSFDQPTNSSFGTVFTYQQLALDFDNLHLPSSSMGTCLDSANPQGTTNCFLAEYYDEKPGEHLCEPCSESGWFPLSAPGMGLSDREAPFLGFQARVKKVTESDASAKYLCCLMDVPILYINGRPSLAFPPMNITGLEPYTEYNVALRAAYLKMNSARYDYAITDYTYSERVMFGAFTIARDPVRTAEGLPSQPPHFVAVSTSESDISVSWAPPNVPNGEILEYQLEQTPGSTSPEFKNLSKAVSGLQPNTVYSFRVRARTLAGWGEWSGPVNASTFSMCPLGQERQSQSGVCTECERGFYGYFNSAGSPRCRECPAGLIVTDGAGAKSVEECLAPAGSFRVGNTSFQCDSTLENSDGVRCNKTGITLSNLPLKSGYWRPTRSSSDIKLCPNSGFCVEHAQGENRTGRLLQTSDELDKDIYCREGHTGVLCEDCIENFAIEEDYCKPCTEDLYAKHKNRFILWCAIYVALIVFPSGLVLQATLKPRDRSLTKNGARRPSWFSSLTSITSYIMFISGIKFRIYIGFGQLLYQYIDTVSNQIGGDSAMDVVFDIVFNLRVTEPLKTVSIGCYRKLDHIFLLKAYSSLPLLIILGMLITLALLRLSCVSRAALQRAKERAIWMALYTLFYTYTGISAYTTQVWVFQEFSTNMTDPDQKIVTLMADYTLTKADIEENGNGYAIFMAILYPFGVVVVFLVCAYLYHEWSLNRRSLPAVERDAAEVAPIQAAKFLCHPYTSRAYFWEAWELVRKLTLSSIFLLVFHKLAGPAPAAALFELFAALFLVIYSKAQPYEVPADQVLAEFSLLLLMIVAAVTTFDSDVVPKKQVRNVAIIIETIVFAFLFVVQVLEPDSKLFKRRDDADSPAAANANAEPDVEQPSARQMDDQKNAVVFDPQAKRFAAEASSTVMHDSTANTAVVDTAKERAAQTSPESPHHARAVGERPSPATSNMVVT